MDIHKRETALMRLIFSNTLIASHCEVESIVGVEQFCYSSQEWAC